MGKSHSSFIISATGGATLPQNTPIMEMAKYILQILRSQPIVVFSWGFHRAYPISNGLRFSVNGYLHQGEVEVVYNEGADLFVVNTFNDDGTIKQQETDVYLDCLVRVIDGLVERIDNYKEKVLTEYGAKN